MKNKTLIFHIILIICLFIGSYLASDDMNIGRNSSSEKTTTFLILLLPSLIGIVVLWTSFPLITIMYFAIKNLKKKVFNLQVLIISFLYLIGIHFYHTELKNDFSDNFINTEENYIFYKNNYKIYDNNILSQDLNSSLKNITISPNNQPKNLTATVSTLTVKGLESDTLDEFSEINNDGIDKYYALKVTKYKLGFDTTKSSINQMSNLTFSTSIVKFKIKCLLGLEKSCLCQSSIEEKNFIYYYGQPVNLNFINIYNVYFALTYLLTLVSVIILFGINIHSLIKQYSDKANS
jgi:hypothetical protein